MVAPEIDSYEAARLNSLRAYHILDTDPEVSFDEITAIASYIFQVPMAMISLMDESRQWFKSRVGLEISELPRHDSFCTYTIQSTGPMLVSDTAYDARFGKNPRVVGPPWVRFYAGVPLVGSEGYPIGTLCVMDTRPRHDFDAQAQYSLAVLGRHAMAQIEMRLSSMSLAKTFAERKRSDMQQLLQFRISSAIGDAPDFDSALAVSLEQVCNATGWTLGEAWVPAANGEYLESAPSWYAARPGFERFRSAAERLSLRPDEGLPGRAWKQGRPIFESNVVESPGFRRTDVADLLHLCSAMAFPIQVENATVAVLAFFSCTQRDEDRFLFDLISSITQELGHVMHRKAMERLLREHEAELSRVNDIKDQFLAMLAHELRNPLAPILTATALLQTPAPGDAVAVIERQVKHMAHLLDDLLDISRIKRGKITLHMRRVDLVKSVREAIRTAGASLPAKPKCIFEESLPDTPVWVEADPVRLEQIIGNLLSNAIKYSEDGKPIFVHLDTDERCATVRVVDQGIGVEKAMLESIFEPFVQVDSTLARTRGGLGLGLPLVRQLVEMHEGRVWAASEGPGTGTEVTVRLPLAGPPEAGEEIREPVSKGSAAPHRILLVEDNRDLSTTLSRLLRHWGHAVCHVSDGAKALEAAKEFKPDLALIDIGLPDIDGYEVAKQLSSAEELHDLHLIAMTGYGQEADRQKATNAGFRDYLLKPVDPASLNERLHR